MTVRKQKLSLEGKKELAHNFRPIRTVEVVTPLSVYDCVRLTMYDVVRDEV